MILKNLSGNFAQLILILFLSCSLVTPLQAQDKPLEELKEKFEQGAVFTATFDHETIDSYTQDTSANGGRIWVGQDKYKVRASHQSVVVNGETSMVYDENRNRVIISKYEPEEDDFAPSRILNGIDSTFTVEVQEERDDKIYIRLTSDDSFAIYKKVEIYLSKALIPRRIRAVDPVENIVTTTFKGGKFVPSAENTFLLDYPSGAEVVDMRN